MSELASPSVVAAIIVMALAAYVCRASGYFAMHLIPATPRVRRALAALPGCVIAASVLPVVDRIGPVAAMALGAALLVMLVRRSEILALLVGLGVAAGARALGM